MKPLPEKPHCTKKNNLEQFLESPISKKELLEAAEQKSGFIVQQKQKLLSEHNRSL
jgi:hypothetical protein